ncbi:hypothetical protein BVY03_02230 [bacterium K02(2017)]|nr:hypothetical protein BVY03_02230 [bacterium K02(2017)]
MKKTLIAVILIFISWNIIDILVHGLLLKSTYESTAHLWRPEAEMMMGLLNLVKLFTVILFIYIYKTLVHPKNLFNAIKYAALIGLLVGIPMGFATYSFQPIPINLAWSWLVSVVGSYLVAGIFIGKLID